jgi:5-formyltetrahydrofolate cyclo-ligase
MDIGMPRIGLFFIRQQVDAVPRDTHDQMLEAVVTEPDVMRF